MATQPSTTPDWATNSLDETTIINGETVLVTNKIEPPAEFQNTGLLAREPLARPYLNYQFDLIAQWIRHLNERVAVGDFYLAATTETATGMGDRFGGTWTDHGTDTVAGQTVRLFERTA